jgi:hypothetical protein
MWHFKNQVMALALESMRNKVINLSIYNEMEFIRRARDSG